MDGEHKKDVNPQLISKAIGELHKITIRYKPKYPGVRESYNPKSCWENAKLNPNKIKTKSEAKKD